jgi:phosphopantetheine--protein transferase-like protein
MTQETLRNTVAEFFQVDPGAVRPEFVLGGPRLSNSLARGHLDSAIRRRVGAKLALVHSARTYGELEAELLGAPAPQSPASPDHSSNGASKVAIGSIAVPAINENSRGVVQCGVDIELVENLPKAADYWEHEFYRTHFTGSEIAYCLMQENPPIHFAARWCAKEALKKCDGRFLKQEMTSIEVASSEGGAMVLRHIEGGSARLLPHALSISHTRFSAIAVVMNAELPASPIATSTPIAPSVKPPDPAARGGLAKAAFVLALIGMVLAAMALLRVFHAI